MEIKPILFNTEMVRAILDERKSCTRRLVKYDVEAVLNSPYHKAHSEVEDKQIISKLCNVERRKNICNRKQNDRIGVHFWSCQRRWR